MQYTTNSTCAAGWLYRYILLSTGAMYIYTSYCMCWSCLFYMVLHAQCWPKWCKVYSNSMQCCHSWKCNVLYIIAMCVCDQYVNTPCAWANRTLQSTVKHALALLWLVAHLNGQVGWVSLHLLSLLLLLLPCWWPLPFWTCFDTVPSPCMEGGSSPASQEGLGQLRGAAQLTMS